MKRNSPVWKSSANTNDGSDQLYLYNSFTKQKELFKPISGRLIKWYSCGPTVYDESHMGHARCYISFDILRRVLQYYFNYDIIYCMNVTDIDDKIIIKARQEHLFSQYSNDSSNTIEKIKSDLNAALSLRNEKFTNEVDKDKKEMYRKSIEKLNNYLNNTTTTVMNGNQNHVENNDPRADLLANGKDILSAWLDKEKGKEIIDNSIFESVPKFYEAQFNNDMAALNIMPPSVVTRVSEYVPEIVEFIQKIIDNGFAYESNGSVYFNTVEFDKCSDHYYAKLVPEAFGDSEALAEGEGALSNENTIEKRNVTDFALWKASKPGEPRWSSPWGEGRPGWHIECSAMAGAIFGPQVDIHSGGIDLKFPHHDNEIAQSEAAFKSDSWVNFFLHSGHLHIQGCKMSKSLKNFITIKDALQKYTSKQIRILFLLHSWKDTLDYSDVAMDNAINHEKRFSEFFLKLKDCLRDVKFNDVKNLKKWTKAEYSLNEKYHQKRASIHEALCDSINTRTVMEELSALITFTNTYLKDNNSANYNSILLREIGSYITNLLRIFGVYEGFETSIGYQSSSEVTNVEQTLMPYLNALSKFRDDVRNEARTNKQSSILKLCDDIRDNVLPELGVRLEDQGNDRTIVKLCDKEQLLKEREQKIRLAKEAEEKKRLREEQQKAEQKLKEAKMAIAPKDLFTTVNVLNEEIKYSKFDDTGFPLSDLNGEELTKSAVKKLRKMYDQQVEAHEKYLKSKSNEN